MLRARRKAEQRDADTHGAQRRPRGRRPPPASADRKRHQPACERNREPLVPHAGSQSEQYGAPHRQPAPASHHQIIRQRHGHRRRQDIVQLIGLRHEAVRPWHKHPPHDDSDTHQRHVAHPDSGRPETIGHRHNPCHSHKPRPYPLRKEHQHRSEHVAYPRVVFVKMLDPCRLQAVPWNPGRGYRAPVFGIVNALGLEPVAQMKHIPPVVETLGRAHHHDGYLHCEDRDQKYARRAPHKRSRRCRLKIVSSRFHSAL